ncbi:Amine oxidase [Candidatus Methanoperedens nitroreducens]|uniref:Amine oxidase n=1 Tax=Candidatus Methanoperedens nitratireducens TaxID=1392998 RepID=A0A284VII4_9EURY|nr:Amine oxidase [Candidatus Methanoperedens nitroreducens]
MANITYISNNNKLKDVRTAILGGGLTGITLARLLQKKGEEVTVLEREPDYGGLCRSMSNSGFTFDRGGSHIIFSRDTEVLTFIRDVLGENSQQNRRNTKIFYKGLYIKYPFENGLYQLPKEDLFFCINEFIRTMIAVEKGELEPPKNFREWIIYTFGKGIADLYLIPYNEKIWKFPAERMSLHWVEGRIPRPPVEDVIKSAIGIETEGYTHQAVFSYPKKGGIEALIRAIALPIKEKIRTGFPVSSIREKDGIFTITDGTYKVTADRCISTIPLQELLRCLDDVPERVRISCDELKYNSLACVFIGIKGKVPDISWLYVHEKDLGLFNRVSFPSNYSPEVAPPGHSSMLVEITYHKGDHVSAMPDREIINHTIAALKNMNIIKTHNEVVYTALERQKYAYVIYDLDYLRNIAIVKDFCMKRSIMLVGRFAEFEYLNMDGCISNALNFTRNR